MKANIIFWLLCILIIFSGCSRNRMSRQTGQIRNDNEYIYYLIDNNNIDAICELIENGFDINSISEDGFLYTPLIYSIKNDKTDVTVLLLENNSNIELCTTFGSPLAIAAEKNNFDLIKLLISKGANINNNFRFYDNSATYRSALFGAVINLNYEMYDYLIERGADVNIGKDLEHENALMALLVQFKNDEYEIYRSQITMMVKKLIHDGIDLNNIVWYGNVLTVAAYRNDIYLMELLLQNGADLNNFVQERDMNTFDYICTFGSNEIIELIKRYYKK